MTKPREPAGGHAAESVVQLAPGVFETIVEHARVDSPRECCGLLIGRGETVTAAARTRNDATDPNRFVVSPEDHIRIRREARERDLDVVGFYHSHPHSAPEPSPTDAREAAYPGHLYFIASLAGDEPTGRMFRWDGERFVGVPFRLPTA